jgi:predicted transcriptional regulator
MSVNAVCNHNVETIRPDADIVEAAARMRDAHVGDLIVAEYRDGREVPIGIITDRDIVVAVIAKGIAPESLKVRDVASTGLLTVRDDSGIEHALRDMRRVGVRRAPVIDSDGELRGVLSIDDVVDHLAVQLDHIADIIRLEQQKEADQRR